MKIAICAPGEIYGGVERQVTDLCSFLPAATGIAPRVYLFHDREQAARIRETGIEPVILGGGKYDPRTAARLGKLLDRDQIEVLHVHGYKATIAAALALRTRRVGLVKTEHGKLEATVSQPLKWLKSRLNFRLEQWATRSRVDRVCYVTADIGRFYDSLHAGLERRVVHNGIESLEAIARPCPKELEGDHFHVGIIGRVSPVKGIPFALEAMTRPGIPPELRLVVIGSGPQIAELESMSQELGLGDRVRFVGFQTNVYEWLAHLDLLLMPSHHEGLPYTLLEAMSLGCPVFVSRIGGLAEVLSDGETGGLFDVGDVDAIAAGLARLAGDPLYRDRLAARARTEQQKLYSLQRMGESYLRTYAEAAGARS